MERAEAPVPAVAPAAFPRTGTLGLFGSSIFVGAALVFLLEPMVGKMLLPLLGGATAVWLVTLVFFQAALLGGYAFAHLSLRVLGLRRQTVGQLLLVLVPLPLLPVALPAHANPPTGSPTLWLLGLLALTAGLPFFVVTTASPVLQRWFSASGHAASADPYFLYATGNAGSLLALVAYPFLIEPHLTLAGQAKLWAAGYGVFVVLLAWSARRVFASGVAEVPAAPVSASIPNATRVRWIAMAALPSSLMLGTTSYLAPTSRRCRSCGSSRSPSTCSRSSSRSPGASPCRCGRSACWRPSRRSWPPRRSSASSRCPCRRSWPCTPPTSSCSRSSCTGASRRSGPPSTA